jgi:hypothetical protein
LKLLSNTIAVDKCCPSAEIQGQKDIPETLAEIGLTIIPEDSGTTADHFFPVLLMEEDSSKLNYIKKKTIYNKNYIQKNNNSI